VPSPRPALPDLPQVWSAADLGEDEARPTGHPALDAQLPGGGWPVGSLVELLQARPQSHLWQLLLPALGEAVREKPGPVVLVAPPLVPFGPSLAAQGLPPQRLLCVHTDRHAASLWAAEQALKCVDVRAVLAWVPQARNSELRRLHLVAQQHGKLLFAVRGLQARNESSPARLRLVLEGLDELRVHIVKRRGPPVTQPVLLAARPERLAALLDSRKGRAPVGPAIPRENHVLDRAVAVE
jgi:protein ImuA